MSKKPSYWRQVPCPATSYYERGMHWARYHSRLRFWQCDRCGLLGSEAGYERMVELAVERFDLATSYAFWEPPGGGSGANPRKVRRGRGRPRPGKV